ncbi:MAG: serine/threonine-protein kinase [Polyangiaceae bacterium]
MVLDSSGASPLVPGVRLDRYELLCPIAQGGMAAVWVARLKGKHGFEKLLALKTILPEYANEVSFQEMLLDEARIAAGIHHVNVAQVLDLGEQHGVLYFAMECVDGDSVAKLFAAITEGGETFPLAVALRIVADAAAGLHAAHELRDKDGQELHVVHRDVSPQNILIDASGTVKIIDFGIARARDRVAAKTRTGSIKGKIQFMSPEQATGRPVDRRADVWGAGAVLYKLLAGKPPFEGPNKYQTLHQIASGERPPPLPPEVPPAVAAIAMRALAYDANDRFATALDMRRAIEAAMGELGLVASSSDLSSLLEKHLSERLIHRRSQVDAALRAAAERDRQLPAMVSSLRLSAPSFVELKAVMPPKEGVPTVILGSRAETESGSVALTMSSLNPRRLAITAGVGIVATILLVAFAWRSKSGGAGAANAPAITAPIAEPVAPPAAASPNSPPAPVALAPPAPALPAVEPVATKPMASTVPAPAVASGKGAEPASRTSDSGRARIVETKKSVRRAPPAPKAAVAEPRAPSIPTTPTHRETVVDDGF